MLAKNASSVCPLSVLPPRSLIVTLNIIGRRQDDLSIVSTAAAIAALAFSVSNIVSIRIASTPPSIKASI